MKSWKSWKHLRTNNELTKEQIGEMVRFSIVGVLITVIHYAVYWLLQLVINVNIAWTAGYIVGFVFKKLK
jgi:putative flippase GtrA